jgi:lipopolysaccharide transport system permease protein
LFAFSALLPWQLFSRTLLETSNSLVGNQRLISRVYFPRIIVPISATMAALLDFAISAGLLALLMVFYRVAPGLEVAALPYFVALMIVTSLGAGFWLSSLNLEYRDVARALPFATQVLLFATPVVYPTSVVPENLRLLYSLNPMVGVVEGFRWALFGAGSPPGPSLGLSTLVAVTLFVSGIYWFRIRERTFIDTAG